ncbi:hypothetical protein DEM27_27080 [Metarhizobium album]|uniref:Uncharacterized protein n=1 Tax=Metarhizobium album TaxID=2182425 RepID=A0A2U2DIC1_9HYPH|nr:hypothetical protein [Rhizobium album]PWE53044.1 hypothetical protein DEM27_27080 [Rhizobium album]
MAVYRDSKKCLRDWLVGRDDAARALHVSVQQLRALVDDGFIRPAARKGFFRLGSLIDGHVEAVRLGRIKAPHERGQCKAGHLKAVVTANGLHELAA